MDSTGTSTDVSGEAQTSTPQQPNQSAAVTATTASSSTARPLKEEKTEPYYPDDSRKAPAPSPEELAQFGVKIRDFGYESKLPPIRPYKPPPFQPPLIQKQPTPLSQRLWLARLAAGNGVSSAGDGASLSTAGAGSERSMGGLVRQRVVQDLQEPEQSQQSTYSSQYSGGSQSLPPLEYITSQESEPYIETPIVTPNGSLHWRNTSHIPIDMLDVSARISAEDLVEPKRSLSSNSDPLASPPPSTAELTLPSLHSPIPGSSRTRLASEAAVEPEPSRPLKRQRVMPPESPSPPSRRATSSGPVSPSQGLDNSLPSAPSTPPLPPSPPTRRYNLRERRPAATGTEQRRTTRAPRSRGSFTVQSAQVHSKSATRANGSRATRGGTNTRVTRARTRGRGGP
ncbi:hypothetical protein DFJ43DRAFT_1038998 [Lentinula guzmanii]|uniref:Uncharacterized protein n=1 Tax=Lentinula guzmanii TaxID=2804957 RepID=A0AA38JTX8_9AGAR|nr:hypothetical protein DFJ43DRAFT_1038998 [Lentinula guzmanii]